MKKALRRRFWLETGMGIATGILFVITLISHEWIEIIFNVDPDQSNGLLEWSIVWGLLVVTVALVIASSYELRRVHVIAV